MKPEDVPDDLVNLAAMVALEHNPDGPREELARFLADVLPAHEAFVRAKVAEEIENENSDPNSDYDRGLYVAARIARGEGT